MWEIRFGASMFVEYQVECGNGCLALEKMFHKTGNLYRFERQ